MSIAGIPPFGGFWSKLLIILATVQAGYLGYACVAVSVSVLTLAFLTKVMKHAFFGELGQRWQAITEVPRCMQGAMLALALVCVLGGTLLLPGLREVFLHQAAESFIAGTNTAEVVLANM